MDFQAVIQQFFDESGHLHFDSHLTLPALGELLYQRDTQPERPLLRFFDYSQGEPGVVHTSTRRAVHTRILATAARLQQIAHPGDRVALCAPNCPEYLYGFLGAIYAALLPVPLYNPAEPGHHQHMRAVLEQTQPAVILTVQSCAGTVRSWYAHTPRAQRPRILALDALPDTVAAFYEADHAATQRWYAAQQFSPIDTPALLQFTSGATRTPVGVCLSHRNILANIVQILASSQLLQPVRFVCWLPLHHDMGLILAALCVLFGHELDLMRPQDFLMNPQRWLDRLAADSSGIAVATCIPNFALEYVTQPEVVDFSAVDLSAVAAFVVGSEAVNPTAVRKFLDLAEPRGFSAAALWPTYGLAESTLLAALPQEQPDQAPYLATFDREALAAGQAVAATAGVTLPSCGRSIRAQGLAIVHPDTGQELADAQVGEVWIAGDNVATGYYGNSELTAATFAHTIIPRATDSRAAQHQQAQWLATGDLGVIVADRLYITGRRKDLIIIAGRNHYPQDIEQTAQEASAHIRPAAVAAFAIPGTGTEQLVIMAERHITAAGEAHVAEDAGDAAVCHAIREAVAQQHGVVPADIVVVAAHTLARSTSGKIARQQCRAQYLAQQGQ